MAKMNAYFRLARVEHTNFGIAYSPDDISFDLIGEHVRCDDWKTVTFTLRDGGFSDYQINDNNWPLCSAMLKRILEREASSADSLEWLTAKVVDESGKSEEYFVLHMPERPDVIDWRRSLFAGELVVKPVISPKLAAPHRVFSFRSGESIVIVAHSVKNAILSANCVGVDFIEVPLGE